MNSASTIESKDVSRCATAIGWEAQSRPVSALKASALSDRFRCWSGRSGRRYMFSIYPADSLSGGVVDGYEDAVVIAARRRIDGSRRISRIGVTSSLPGLCLRDVSRSQAEDDGPLEFHVHLLAKDRAERLAIVEDLAPAVP